MPDTQPVAISDEVPLDDRIAHDIHTGRLSPGSWLKGIDIEARYGVERPAVRAALDALAKRRLVQHLPNRGYRVAEFSAQQIREIFHIRSILEKSAAELIIQSADDARVETAHAGMLAAAKSFETSLAEGDLPAQIAAARAFHLELLSLCPNQELIELILEMRDRIPASILRAWHSRERMSKSVEQHYQMAEALAARDVERLKALLDQHILGSSPAWS